MNDQHAKRRRELLRTLDERGLDCLLVIHPANRYYLTGFTGESGVLVVGGAGTTLLTDGRFTVQAKEETRGVRVELQQGALYGALGEFLRKRGMRRVGFDPGQWTVAQLKTMRKAAGAKCRAAEAGGIVERLRKRKDEQELGVMRRAAVLAGEVLESTLKLIRPGVREREIGAEIEYQMKQRGASGSTFETIVAPGGRAAR